jgi:UDP-glucose 4-epimerase
VARAAILASEHPGAEGKIYNVTDGTVHTLRKIVNAMAQGCQFRPLIVYLPQKPFYLAVAALERTGVSTLPGVRTVVAMIRKINENVSVSGQKIIRELNFTPQRDLTSGMRDVIRQ